MKIIPNYKYKKSGFTLIEVVIAVGLFSIVMMVSLAIILSLVDNNKKVHSVNVVVDNLNFSIDSMVRDIKTGRSYRCGEVSQINEHEDPPNPAPCNNGDHDAITLISTLYNVDRMVEYKYVKNADEPGKIVKTSCDIRPTDDPIQCLPNTRVSGDLTSSEIDITKMQFIINQGDPGSSQPYVFLLMDGTAAVNPTEASDFSIQTLISQRVLNI